MSFLWSRKVRFMLISFAIAFVVVMGLFIIRPDIVKSKNKFVLTYNKYVVNDPYKVLNYYNDKNDTNKIIVTSSYLKGERNITSIKSVINKDNIKEFGKIEKSRKVVLKFIDREDKIIVKLFYLYLYY